MSGGVFLMVIGAALLHACWNALVKGGSDKTLGIAAVVVGQAIFALLVIPFVPLPAWECWPWFLASIVLHIGYQFFLGNAYRTGDLTQVYPIARGVAPLIVGTVSVVFLGVVLDTLELVAIAVIAAGIMSLSLVRQRDGLRNRGAAGLALVTGCFIAGYSLVDGTGARIAGTGVGFYAWSSFANTIFYILIGMKMRPTLLRDLRGMGKVILLGGSASFVAYAMVVNAFMHAPIALVTALRETSIIFALLIGVGFLGERLDLSKVFSTMMTLCGAALLRLSKG